MRCHIAIGRRAFRQITKHSLRCLWRGLDVDPGDADTSRGRREIASDNFHGGGLASTVRAQKSEDFALFHFQIDTAHGGDRAKFFSQVLDFNHCLLVYLFTGGRIKRD